MEFWPTSIQFLSLKNSVSQPQRENCAHEPVEVELDNFSNLASDFFFFFFFKQLLYLDASSNPDLVAWF